MKRYAYDHKPIEFDFRQSVERFHVEEIPQFDPSNRGEYLYLHIKKYDLSTWRLIHVLKEATGASDREIGYAGLKDKSATTSQYITLPKKLERGLKNITTDRIKILEKSYNHLPLKIGQLKGNRFKIILTNISNINAARFDKVARKIELKGFPNYFGYQRFGEDGKSWKSGKEIAHSGKKLKGAKEKLLVSAYQSYLFNNWLSSRVRIGAIISTGDSDAISTLSYPPELVRELAKQPQLFKIFIGDSLMQYPNGKSSYCKNMQNSANMFVEKKISVTGLLAGNKAQRSHNDARHLEAPYDDDELISLGGDRRFSWIWPEQYSSDYDAKGNTLTVKFTLSKGSYATSFLEEIAKRSLKPSKEI